MVLSIWDTMWHIINQSQIIMPSVVPYHLTKKSWVLPSLLSHAITRGCAVETRDNCSKISLNCFDYLNVSLKWKSMVGPRMKPLTSQAISKRNCIVKKITCVNGFIHRKNIIDLYYTQEKLVFMKMKLIWDLSKKNITHSVKFFKSRTSSKLD